MNHKWGCQVPNGEFTPEDVVSVFGDGVYLVMQENFARLAVSPDGSPGLRDRAKGALIVARFYLPNWYTTDPRKWAAEIGDILRQRNPSDPHGRTNAQLIDCYTWANEQNLKSESGEVVGAPGIQRGDYEKMLEWNVAFLDAADAIPDLANILRVFPALAWGNSDDQDDGAGVGLEILQPVIKRCQYGAIHPYWHSGLRIDDEWRGLGRIHKQLPFFNGLPILGTETGNFAVDRSDAAQQYLDAGYYMQGIQQFHGFCYFIFADPTKKHQQNDMSRNPLIYDALRRATRIPRPVYVAPEPVLEPKTPPEPIPPVEEPSVPNSAPQTSPGKLLIGYQVWQWNNPHLPQNYERLGQAMRNIGALLLTDKYSDSSALQGEFDNGAMAIKTIQVMKDRRQWCEDNGFIYAPWDVPRAIPIQGNAFEGARQEALFHARVCNEVGLKFRVSDLEFYESFFGYDLESRGGRSFFASMQERQDAAELYYRTFAENSDTETLLQPDLRQFDVLTLHRLLPYIRAVIGQSYAYWFQTLGDQRSHAQIIQDFIDKTAQLQAIKPELELGLCLYCETGTPRDTPVAEARELMQQAAAAGAKYLLVYKAPVTSELNGVISSFAQPSLEPGGDNPDAVKAEAWAAAEGVRAEYGQKFAELAERARKLGYGWMGNGLDAARLAVESAELAAKTAIKAPEDN